MFIIRSITTHRNGTECAISKNQHRSLYTYIMYSSEPNNIVNEKRTRIRIESDIIDTSNLPYFFY